MLSLLLLHQPIKRASLQPELAHGCNSRDRARLPLQIDTIPVWREVYHWTTQMLFRLFGNGDSLRLPPLCCEALLLSDARKYLYRYIIYHLKNPALLLRKFHHGSRDVKNFDPNVMLSEVFQFFLDITLSPAESIRRFNNQSISVTEKVILQRLKSLTLQILSAHLIRNDIPFLTPAAMRVLAVDPDAVLSWIRGHSRMSFSPCFYLPSVSKAPVIFGYIPKQLFRT